MNIANTKFKKALLISLSAIVLAIVLVIAFISPIAKYLVEKYDEKYTGRKVTMAWAYVNPFTGYVYFHNIKIYEYKSDSIMLSANGAGGHFALLKLFSSTYEIKELVLDHPRGIIIQADSILNFTDLINKFSGDELHSTSEPVHFNILKIKINDGVLYYHEKLIPVKYFAKNINIESDGKMWDSDSIAFKFSFLSGPSSGSLKGNITINFKTLDYHYDVVVEQLNLKPVEQYINEFANYGTFAAILDADVKAFGNFNDGEDVTAKGIFAVSDFHFGKNPANDFMSFKKLVLDINELSPKKHKYILDSVWLSHPYFKYEQYDYLDNIERVFGKGGTNIYAANDDPTKFNLVLEIARYVKILAANFFSSYYKINRLVVYDGDFQYNDFTMSEQFSMAANPMSIVADSIDKNHSRVDVVFKSGIKPYGDVVINVTINPQDSTDFDIHYHLQKLPATLFNPYIISSTSFPLDRGTLELKGNWRVRNEEIQSDNHLLIIDPRLATRIKNKEAMHLPMPLIMFFVRERGNVIDYEIPITGNLKNPKFHLSDVLYDLLKNIFIKPPTTPYRRVVKNTENEIEKSHQIKWHMRQITLEHNQEEFVNKLVDFLAKNPQASVVIHPMLYAQKEKEYILFYEAKKNYFLSGKNEPEATFTQDDSMKIDKMSIKDSMFVQYLNRKANDSMIFTVQEKCYKLIGVELVNSRFNQLNNERVNAFIAYFKNSGVVNQVKIYADETTIPYNGFSFYKIEYKGEIPESLTKAYDQMNDLNNKTPRLKFIKERKIIPTIY